LPAALFVVDVIKENIAVKEAKRLNIPVFAIVDTNSDPNLVDFPIPANDDAAKSISIIIDQAVKAIQEGFDERKVEKDKEAVAKEKKSGQNSAEEEGQEARPVRTRARRTARKPEASSSTESEEVNAVKEDSSAESEN
jgi:small subunit ribosomal protein S2